MRKIGYREGDIFCVPLREGGFALGVVARMTKDGKVLLGYFFREKLPSCPAAENLPDLRPEDAIKIAKFGGLSLRNGDWPVIGHVSDWDRDKWPMPKFVRRDELSKRAWLVSYAEDNPNQMIGKERCDFGVNSYEDDSLLGAGLVEILLTRLATTMPSRGRKQSER